jgi:hypothetical protein
MLIFLFENQTSENVVERFVDKMDSESNTMYYTLLFMWAFCQATNREEG